MQGRAVIQSTGYAHDYLRGGDNEANKQSTDGAIKL